MSSSQSSSDYSLCWIYRERAFSFFFHPECRSTRTNYATLSLVKRSRSLVCPTSAAVLNSRSIQCSTGWRTAWNIIILRNRFHFNNLTNIHRQYFIDNKCIIDLLKAIYGNMVLSFASQAANTTVRMWSLWETNTSAISGVALMLEAKLHCTALHCTAYTTHTLSYRHINSIYFKGYT